MNTSLLTFLQFSGCHFSLSCFLKAGEYKSIKVVTVKDFLKSSKEIGCQGKNSTVTSGSRKKNPLSEKRPKLGFVALGGVGLVTSSQVKGAISVDWSWTLKEFFDFWETLFTC